MGADDGNRTRMTSLEGWSSTIELHPRDARFGAPSVAYRLGRAGKKRSRPPACPAGPHIAAAVPGSTGRGPSYATLTVRLRRVTVRRYVLPAKSCVRSSDMCPKSGHEGVPAPSPSPARQPCMVVTWPLIVPPGSHVRRADITTKSHLPVGRVLALDTCRRNRHASDQAQ